MSESWPPDYHAAVNGAALFDFHDATKVELAGPDARIFLHNLCTQDVKNLAEGAGCETFLTTAKARVVFHGAVSRVRWLSQDVLWLDTIPGQAERLLAHLNHFLISEQVELADRTSEVAMLRLVGPEAATTLATVLGELPSLAPWAHAVRTFEGGEVLVRYNWSLILPGYDCWCPPGLSVILKTRLRAAGAVEGTPETHNVLRVEAGWPVYGVDMDENRFVVEVGRTAQAICYTKGCYLGQEPIVMARDRGQVNRALLGLRCGADAALAAGTKLLQGETEVGQVTSSGVSPRLQETIALAYLRRGSQESGARLSIEGSMSRTAVVHSLPFLSKNESPPQ